MTSSFQFVSIPEQLLQVIGDVDPETRIYRQAGTKKESGRWFDALCMHIKNGTVSPGGVSMYAEVSRAAVYKRIKEGRLTAFCFHEIEKRRGLLGGTKTVRTSPFIYVPIEEAKAWGQEIAERKSRGEKFSKEEFEGDEPDFAGDFFEWDSDWRKEQLEKFKGKPLR